MIKIHTLDLYFQKENHSIASYLIETQQGPILIETGPMSTFEKLKEEIEKIGYQVKDIENILLTHIHFDHAGAAWKFAEHGAKIFVHPIGVPHLQHPEKLWNSAAQIYGEDMNTLWGEMKPIPEDQLDGVKDGQTIEFGDVEVEVIYTPGHAVHHNAYKIGDVIFTGDVGGVRINNGPVVPPCPPPDINIELWKQSIDKLRSLKPEALYLTHYGKQENPNEVFDELEIVLDQWANYIKPFYEDNIPSDKIVPLFVEFTEKQFKEKGLEKDQIQTYEYANPSWMSVNGLLRYWKLKDQGRI
ncbi:MBL fold metallo-hydrolase [Faecalibacter rhinopitheci]|uniref:MBL fold metallo-hydrolase n=1 Tax=Faecalibacter rhinopitheci TaxID=2779678 RepID=A0A8J7G9Y4_9FLAO|nr:MBL fold metallo-hydrolase [Faecalibacter rhinopitheci]MBF0598250.1 MBL fold metallo-hydrolase [Faecalibacter rhinopitheci]